MKDYSKICGRCYDEYKKKTKEKKMKLNQKGAIPIILMFLFPIVILIGCAGLQLNDDAAGNSIGYFSGKGVGIAVNTGAPNSVDALEKNFDEFMARNAGNELVPPEETLALFNSSVGILTVEVADPYGLISDLTFLISQFGGQIVPVPGETPVLEGVQPIPLKVFKSFEFGYDSGKRVAAQM